MDMIALEPKVSAHGEIGHGWLDAAETSRVTRAWIELRNPAAINTSDPNEITAKNPEDRFPSYTDLERTLRPAAGEVLQLEGVPVPEAAPRSEHSGNGVSPRLLPPLPAEETRAEAGTECAAAPDTSTLPTQDQLVRDLVQQGIPEGAQLQEYEGLRFLQGADGELLHHCAAWLPKDVARQKLEGFLGQWPTQVVRWDEESLQVHVSLDTGWWQWLSGRPSTIELEIHLCRPLPEVTQLSEVTVQLRCLGGRQQKGRQVLAQVAPLLLHSLRSYLVAGPEHRAHERVPFEQPVRFAPAAGPDEGLAIDCIGRDISFGGICFHSPTPPETSHICLFFPVPIGSAEGPTSVTVPATVRQVLPDGSGGYLVRACFARDPALDGRRVLLIQDDPDDARWLVGMQAHVTGLAWELEQVARLARGLERLADSRVDLILLDLSLPEVHELEGLRRVRAAAPAVPVVVLAGGADQEPLALRAVQEGAAAYLVKTQLDSDLLARTFHGAIERQRTRQSHDLKNERQRMLAELEKGREKDRYLAYHDSLIGLPNRSLFYDRLEQALAPAGRKASQVAVMFLDLDGFKRINDTLGHSTGDHLLQAVAQRLKDCVRNNDTVARLGGDEFTIILTDLPDAQAAAQVAEKILQVVARPLQVDGQELLITTSIGISMWPADGTDVETLVKRADLAMYRAKALGKNTYQLYHPSMAAASADGPGEGRTLLPNASPAGDPAVPGA